MKRNRCILLLLFLLSLVGITFYGGVAAYTFFYTCIAVPIICILYLIYVYFRFRIFQHLDRRYIVKGEQVGYHFVLANEDYITFSSVQVTFYKTNSTVENIEETVKRELLPKEKLEFHSSLICKYRGEYPVGVKSVTITDFLQLFSITYHVPYECKTVVYPRIVALQKLKQIPVEEETMSDPYAFLKTEPDVTVRDYVCGDSLKQIHWKLSAKQQKLMTRELSGNNRNKTILILDLSPLSGTEKQSIALEDKIMETAVSLIHYFCMQNISFLLLYGENEIERQRLSSLEMFSVVYEKLAKSSFTTAYSLKQMIEAEHIAGSYCHLIWITHALDTHSFQMAYEIRKTVSRMTVLSITDENMDEYCKQAAQSMKLVVVNSDTELGESL